MVRVLSSEQTLAIKVFDIKSEIVFTNHLAVINSRDSIGVKDFIQTMVSTILWSVGEVLGAQAVIISALVTHLVSDLQLCQETPLLNTGFNMVKVNENFVHLVFERSGVFSHVAVLNSVSDFKVVLV